MKIKTLALVLMVGLGLAGSAHGATILPPGKNCFDDANGASLGLGTVTFYIPTTTTFKTTWQDASEATPNTNPVLLGGDGCAIIYGSGVYRQIVKDVFGVTIWDLLTASTGNQTGVLLYGGTSTGSGNAQVVAAQGFSATDGQLVSFVAGFTNSGATTINAGTGAIPVLYDSTPGGPVALTGGEIVTNNVVVALYTSGSFHLIGPPVPIQHQTITNYQSFTTPGTFPWTKPAFATTDTNAAVHIQCWGSGGGGGANATGGGGGGGAFAERWMLASDLGATENVLIAAGGAISVAGTASSFGTSLDYVSGYGGGAGQNAANGGGGGGGGNHGQGSNGAATNGGLGGADERAGGGAAPANGTYGTYGGGGGGGTTATAGSGGASLYGGGGGGGGTSTGGGVAGLGGDSVYGGGGGSGFGAASAGGFSKYAGNGGDKSVAGTAPAGGGGRNAAGARGECRVWTTP